MQRFGVRSNCIAPNAWSRMISSIPAKTDAEKARVARMQQMTPDKNAPLAVFLASDLARDVTGQILVSRNNEIFLMSQPRPVRAVHRDGGWTPQQVRNVVTVEDVLNSPRVCDPLHRLDCWVISDGGGALVVARADIARALGRPLVRIKGTGEASKGQMGGDVDLTWSAAAWAGADAFAEAGVKPGDIDYASIYDSFTITALMQIEDLGFCEKG